MKETYDAVKKVKAYIDTHLSEELQLNQLAELAGYSKYHLCRVFVETTGMTIHQYIREQRLTEAASLLIKSDCTISDIAAAYGYEYQQSFQLAFKNRFQETPLAYRRRHQLPARRKVIVPKQVCRMGYSRQLQMKQKGELAA